MRSADSPPERGSVGCSSVLQRQSTSLQAAIGRGLPQHRLPLHIAHHPVIALAQPRLIGREVRRGDASQTPTRSNPNPGLGLQRSRLHLAIMAGRASNLPSPPRSNRAWHVPSSAGPLTLSEARRNRGWGSSARLVGIIPGTAPCARTRYQPGPDAANSPSQSSKLNSWARTRSSRPRARNQTTASSRRTASPADRLFASVFRACVNPTRTNAKNGSPGRAGNGMDSTPYCPLWAADKTLPPERPAPSKSQTAPQEDRKRPASARAGGATTPARPPFASSARPCRTKAPNRRSPSRAGR